MLQKITIEENILSANQQIASVIRTLLQNAGILSINFMASPGAGKTTLIEKTIQHFAETYRILAIDGDIATSLDAERAAVAGADALQINTGGQCHLDASMLKQALDNVDLKNYDLLIVENVGNLVCPSTFDLGTQFNILIASTPEGADKPHKYPGMYKGVDLVILNKLDLTPYLDFDIDFFTSGLEVLNPNVQLIKVSCKTGLNLDSWFKWVNEKLLISKNLS